MSAIVEVPLLVWAAFMSLALVLTRHEALVVAGILLACVVLAVFVTNLLQGAA